MPSCGTAAGGMIDLGTLGGSTSQAESVNSLGHVVGRSLTAGGQTHAFLWTPTGGMIDLGTVAGTTYSAASDINDAGVVVGGASILRAAAPFTGPQQPEWWTWAPAAAPTL